MTVATMIDQVLTRLGENPATGGYWTRAEALAALNEAQRFFVLLTLCLEKTTIFAVTAGTTFYHVLPTITDFLLPLRITWGGVKIRPARLDTLTALDWGWQAKAGDPSRYALLGQDFLAIYKQSSVNLSITYAAQPARLKSDTDTPEVPNLDHGALCDYAIPRLRLKEGGQELEKSKVFLGDFLTVAEREAGFTRARALAGRYDRYPYELTAQDRSLLLDFKNYRRFFTPWLTMLQSQQAQAPT